MNFLKKYFVTLGVLYLIQTPVYAIAECPKPNDANDIIKCLRSRHPEVLDADIISDVAKKTIKQGGAWKNPELSLEALAGSESSREFEVRLSQPIETSGRRSARKLRGEAVGLSLKAESMNRIEEVTLYGIKSLFRLSHIEEERALVEESLMRFKKIYTQYRSRPRLNPEQEATFGIVQLAISEFEFKLNQFSAERNELLTEIELTTLLRREEIVGHLPKTPSRWPVVNSAELSTQESSLTLKSKADIQLINSDLNLAKTEAWSEFKLDLIVQDNKEGVEKSQLYGAGISFPLPFLQRNEGEISLKTVELARADKIHGANIKRQEYLLNNLLEAYNVSTKNIIASPSLDSIESKHKKAEQLFNQGLISGPLIVETHRQLIEFTQIKNVEILRTVETLWKIFILQGTFLNQKI